MSVAFGQALGRVGALLVLAAGALHIYLYVDYFDTVHVIGPLFLVNGAFATFVGVALLAAPNVWTASAGIVYAAGTLGGFFFTVYHGLFGYVESLQGPWQEAVGGVEIAAIVLLLPVALGWTSRAKTERPGPGYRRIEAGRIEEAQRT